MNQATDYYNAGMYNGYAPSLNGFRPSAAEAEDEEECKVCNRPTMSILCKACGHTFRGRVRIKCNAHPGLVHLMDTEVCPKCGGLDMKEF
jgi:hypothetical protein